MKYYWAIKKEKKFTLMTPWMHLKKIMLNEMSQSEKDKQHMISLTYGI